MTEVKMPQLGESVIEGTVTKWLKKEGDEVAEDELLVEISTDKVDSEVPSTASGVLQRILVKEGDTAQVGDAIAEVGEAQAGSGDGDRVDAESQAAASAGEAADGQQDDQQEERQTPPPETAQTPTPEAAQTEESQVDTEDTTGGDEDTTGGEGAEVAPAGSDAGSGAGGVRVEEPSGDGAPPESGAPADTSKRQIISPLVRRLADEHGVDLTSVEGTGTGGRIRKQDVLAAVDGAGTKPAREPEAPSAAPGPLPAAAEPAETDERPAPAAPRGPAEPAPQREQLVPWTNIRRRTAEHMIASHLETARAWNAVEVDWTEAVKVREAAKASFRAREGFNLTYMPFLARALCETLLEMPEVNSTYDEANKANLVKHYVNLGIAVALEGGGLIVPVVKGADEKNLVGLARSISDVAERARAKKVTPDDLQGGSFTITNPGPFGSVVSVPIIPRGQTAILGFEAIKKRVVVTADDALAVRSIGFLTMSWDHRAIDGAEAARFLAALRERIETADFSADLSPYL